MCKSMNTNKIQIYKLKNIICFEWRHMYEDTLL